MNAANQNSEGHVCGDVPSFDHVRTRPADAGSVLTSPVFSVKLKTGEAYSTLPGLLAACHRGDLTYLPGVRAHQSHTVHMFLAQLYALALEVVDESADLSEEMAWHDAMLRIETGFGEEIWEIVSASDESPAFMQPAVPSGVSLSKTELSVSGIDLLVTANQHLTKSLRDGGYQVETWIWHLITLQTGAGFPGRGNYGCFRMNGGFGSRSLWAVYDASWTMGDRIVEDAKLINERLAETTRDYGFSHTGKKLLWAHDWQEGDVLSVNDLDPRVIEICRRIRLDIGKNGEIYARVGNSAAARTDLGKTLRGEVGDIWSPTVIEKDGAKPMAMTGLGYGRIARAALGVGGDIRPAPAALRRVENGVLVAAGVANGQGKTEGFHSRSVPFTNIADASGWGSPEIPQGVSGTADLLIKEARKAVWAMEMAAIVMNAGAPDDLSANDRDRGRSVAAPYSEELSEWVDRNFFPALNDRIENGDDARVRFATGLYRKAEQLAEKVIDALPGKAANRFRCAESARRTFGGVFFKKGAAGEASFNDIREKILKGERDG